MTLDCDKYRVNVEPIRSLVGDKVDPERTDFVGALSLSTGVPIIIVAHYLAELYGMSDVLTSKIETLTKFYGIKRVLNYIDPKIGKIDVDYSDDFMSQFIKDNKDLMNDPRDQETLDKQIATNNGTFEE